MVEPSGKPGPSPPPTAPPPRKLRNLAWVATSYFGEGLPWSFLHQMGTEYLTAIRAPNSQVGYTSWLHLAVTLKFLWSPVVDLAGTKRRWMIVMQVLLGLGMIGVGAISTSGLEGLGVFWIALGVLAIMHATHDIACDGYYLLALGRSDQALYSGPRIAAFRLAMLVGSSGLVVLAGRTSWFLGFAAAGVLMTLVGVINALVVPHITEPPKPAREKGSSRNWRAFFAAYATFFDQPQIVRILLFMLTLKLGDIMMFAMSKPLLRDIGLDTSWRGVLNGISSFCTIGGAMVAGWWISRRGLERALIPIIYIMNLAIPLYAVLAWVAPPIWIIIPTVCIEQFAAGMGATAQSVFLMQRCRRAFSASHYAFATAITALGTTFSGAFSGHLNTAVGHRWYFILCIFFGIPSMILVLIVPRTPVDDAPPTAK
jgi:PAT family beta-lactamase induction signal transducer AmpG